MAVRVRRATGDVVWIRALGTVGLSLGTARRKGTNVFC